MTTVLEVQNLNSADANAEPVTAAEATSQSRLFVPIFKHLERALSAQVLHNF
jgi:hypothetical protein